MPDEVDEASQTAADENAKNTSEGNAHADHTETGEETRGALQRWGSSSPGQNTLAPTGDSPPSEDAEPAEAEGHPSE
jgi:hypothetical protein